MNGEGVRLTTLLICEDYINVGGRWTEYLYQTYVKLWQENDRSTPRNYLSHCLVSTASPEANPCHRSTGPTTTALVQARPSSYATRITRDPKTVRMCQLYRGADKSLARPTYRCILFDGENISFHARLVIYILLILHIYIYIYIYTLLKYHIYIYILLIFLQLL